MRFARVGLSMALSCCALHAQDLDKLQIHGFATQGFLFSSHNNFIADDASSGTLDWTDAAVSIANQPVPKLRIGVQLHFYRFGYLGGDNVMVDWALGDYRFNDHFGVRAGKVKRVIGLFNNMQDVDATYLWTLLPQSVYSIENRDILLSDLGVEGYGTWEPTAHSGKFSYNAHFGETSLPLNTGYVEQFAQILQATPAEEPSSREGSVDIRWQSPYKPLTLGSGLVHTSIQANGSPLSVTEKSLLQDYYVQLEPGRFSFSGEYRRNPIEFTIVEGPYSSSFDYDQRQWYAMASCHATGKLQVGTYYSHLAVPGPVIEGFGPQSQSRKSKDLVLSGRYDFNDNFYAKAETHFLHGEAIGYLPSQNPQGLTARSTLVMAKLGFTF